MRNVSNWSRDVIGVDPDDPLYDDIAHVLAQMWFQFQFEPTDPVVQAQARKKAEERARRRVELQKIREAEPEPPAPEPIVYYLRVGKLIKIGTTVNLTNRLGSYPPDTIVLATEPGSYDRETARHRQFRANLAHPKEWFHPSAGLIAHINSLRETPLTAADLAA